MELVYVIFKLCHLVLQFVNLGMYLIGVLDKMRCNQMLTKTLANVDRLCKYKINKDNKN